MLFRSLLRKQLAEAWLQTIKEEYSDQLINSERGLQAYFCKHLLDQFAEDGVSRRLFIEPRLTISNAENEPKYPDIVICNTKGIIGVVEIKYMPRARPEFEKDLCTLDWILQNQAELTLSNDRYLGELSPPKKYPLANEAVLCWAGVYMAPETVIALNESRNINQQVLALHAITSSGAKAKAFVKLPGAS